MRLIFDASTQSYEWWQTALPIGALLLTIIAFARGARPLWKWGGVFLTLLLLVAMVIGPIVDLHHVQAAMREGRTKTVEGPISMHKRETVRRWAGDSRGVGITTTRRYTSSTSEQFFVGKQWFWLRVNGYGSNASFTNGGEPPLPLHDSTIARVTWFEDPWYDNETRILRLELGPELASSRQGTGPLEATPAAKATSPAATGLQQAPVQAPADFIAFWKDFSSAAASGNEAGVAALTRFPFLFAGTPLERERFDSVWAGIFPEPLRPCFASSQPVKDGNAWSLSCGAYVYVFERGTEGWRLTGFTADPEALQ